MAQEVRVVAEHEYSVLFVDSWQSEFAQTKKSYVRNLVFAPESLKEALTLEDLIGPLDAISYLPDGENAKTFETLQMMWSAASEAGIKRSDAIWGIGGGATTDSSGFAAATWLRGVSWHAIPTTLAGMVDASIGGKTGINSPAGKNLIGSFHSPASVIIDPSFLQSLSDRDFSAGLAEIIKTGFIADVEILNLLNKCTSVADARSIAPELILRSVKVKADVVSQDFKESKLREILNYGHTFGHAVERHSNYSLRHGECVAIGMVFVAELAKLDGKIDEALVLRHVALLEKYNLPITYKGGDWNELLAHMANDKKSRGSLIRFVVLTGVGSTVRLEGPSSQLLKQSYERVSG